MQPAQIMLECRVPNGTVTATAVRDNLVRQSRSWIDMSYTPVPLGAHDQETQISIDATGDTVVLIRGEADPELLSLLSQQPKVLGVYADSDVVPFGRQRRRVAYDDWRVEIGSRSPTACPIPPCDCQPSRRHGNLRDVAAYLGVDRFWNGGITGEGIVIGVVDAGICAEGRMDPTTTGLVPRVIDGWPQANWGTLNGWRRHGSMCATDALGMAPGASLFDVRVCDGAARGARMSDVIAALHWAVEKYRATGTPHILCCGWGISQPSAAPEYASDDAHPLSRKVVEALDEGILVLFAAGNGGQSCPAVECGDHTGPGQSIWGANGHPRVMTIGAVNKEGQLIGYSGQGPSALDQYKPDLCGVSHFTGYFACDTGTSAACAIVSGVVALLKQACPTLTQEAVKRLLKSTAKDIGPPGWDRHSGSGIVQPKAAFELLVEQHAIKAESESRLQRIEEENRCLKDLYIELVLEKRLRGGSVL